MEPPLFPIVFWCNAREAGLIGAVSLFKFRCIKHLVVAAITELAVHRALPSDERMSLLRGTEGSYPSPSHHRVCCEADFLRFMVRAGAPGMAR